MNLTESMRRDWNDRARKNAFHYIASWRQEWDLESFLASGEEDFQRLAEPALSRCGIPSSGGGAMIELGCGAGRMTGSFARRFDRVYAFDLSNEMLGRARHIHADRANILWLLGNGKDLGCVQTGSVDFVFSYLVLQHLPSKALVLQYVREMLRVLRPGGAFLFQFNGGFEPTMKWRGRLAWGLVDAFWSAGLVRVSRAAASRFGFDPEAAGRSWRGTAIRAERVADAAIAAGGIVREWSGANTPMAWCCGVKGRPEN